MLRPPAPLPPIGSLGITEDDFSQTKLQLRRGSYFASIELPLSIRICRRRQGTYNLRVLQLPIACQSGFAVVVRVPSVPKGTYRYP
jgi:hypothetical protein